jgi:hypothetical protein
MTSRETCKVWQVFDSSLLAFLYCLPAATLGARAKFAGLHVLSGCMAVLICLSRVERLHGGADLSVTC